MKRTFTQMLSLAIVLFGLQSMSAQEQILTINAPEGIAAVLEMGEASAPAWAGALAIGETVTGDLAYVASNVVDDDEFVDDTPVNGCVELGNPDEIMGKIALVERGVCTFSAKVNWAQEAGAIAVIICNNRPVSEDGGGIINMAASDPFMQTDTIPAGFLSQEDCAAIRMALDNGENVNVTIGVKEFVDASAAFTYETPVKNIVPMMGLGATIFVQEDTPVTFTWVVTDPNGVETTLTTTEDASAAAANGNTFSVDEPYIPEAAGTYSVLVSNDVNEETLTTEFIITEEGVDIFALDNGVIDGDVTIAGGDSWTMPATGTGGIFDANMVIRAGDVATELRSIEFGLANWSEMLTDAAGPVEFTFQIYDMDPELDGELVEFPAAGSADYAVFNNQPVAFNIYTVTGDEVDGETATVDLNPFGTFPVIPAGGAYLVSMQYRGETAANGIPPAYLTAGNTCYLEAWDGSIITSQWFSGFVGCPNIVMRTYAPPFVSDVEDVLQESAVVVTPNPVSSELNVAINLENTSEQVQVQVININGAVMVNQTMDNILNANLTYDVTSYPAGTYFIQVATQDGFSVEKFVKH